MSLRELWLSAALLAALGWIVSLGHRLRIAHQFRELEQERNDELTARLMVCRAELQAIQQKIQEAARGHG